MLCGWEGNRRPGGNAELFIGWVNPWVRLGWVGLGRDFSVFSGLGWAEYTLAKLLQLERTMLMHLKHG